MSDFFSEELRAATKEDCKAPWGARANGEWFRCGFCGYKIKEGDLYRVVSTNDLENGWGNPIVCQKCNKNTEVLRSEWVHKHTQYKTLAENNFWWFAAHDVK